MMQELLGYPPPEGISYRASTEKERKQRLHFMNLTSEDESPAAAATPYTEEEEDSPGDP